MARLEHKNIDLDHIAERLERAKTAGQNGNVSFDGFIADEVTAILTSCVQFEAKIPELQRKRILHHAAFEAGKRGVITRHSLLRALTHLEREYLAQPVAPYVLVTTLSVRTWPWRLPERIRIDGTTITFSRQLPKRFDRRPSRRRSQRRFATLTRRTLQAFAFESWHGRRTKRVKLLSTRSIHSAPCGTST